MGGDRASAFAKPQCSPDDSADLLIALPIHLNFELVAVANHLKNL